MGGSDGKFEAITQLSARGPREQGMKTNEMSNCSISQIKNTLLNDEAFMNGQVLQGHNFKVSCEILQIQCNKTMWYTTAPGSLKKVNPEDLNGSPFNYTYNFSMKVADESDSIYVQVLGDYPGNEIIGKSAQQLR